MGGILDSIEKNGKDAEKSRISELEHRIEMLESEFRYLNGKIDSLQSSKSLARR